MTRTAAAWWRAPLWLAQLATGAKSFVDNPILGSPALNRRGLHVSRLKLAHRLAWRRRARLARSVPSEHRAAFDRDGYLCLPDFLPGADFSALRGELLQPAHPAREHRQGDTLTRRVPIDASLVRNSPVLRGLLQSGRWTSLMRYAASTGGEPLYYLQSIVTGLDGPPDPQLDLHSDSFQPALKAWLFLTDVAEDEGPLTYVAGSHRLTPERIAWERKRSFTVLDQGDRLSQRGSLRIGSEELAGLGLPQPTAFAVRANTLVIIDTYGFHARGSSARPSVRVELWAYRRRSPFLPWTGLSLLSLPGLALRRIGWGYALTDWLDARGLWKQHWQPSAAKRATDR